MDLNKELLVDHSKSNTLRVAALIGTDPGQFDQLVQLMVRGNDLIAPRSAWVFRVCVDSHPRLFSAQHVRTCIRRLGQPACDAVKRNITAVLQTAKIPQSEEGIVVDHCFRLLNSRSEPTAVKTFSMTVLHRIAQKYPDLKPELADAIRNQWPLASTGFRNRAAKILKAPNQSPSVPNP